jgi:hypothetical protein
MTRLLRRGRRAPWRLVVVAALASAMAARVGGTPATPDTHLRKPLKSLAITKFWRS